MSCRKVGLFHGYIINQYQVQPDRSMVQSDQRNLAHRCTAKWQFHIDSLVFVPRMLNLFYFLHAGCQIVKPDCLSTNQKVTVTVTEPIRVWRLHYHVFVLSIQNLSVNNFDGFCPHLIN